VVDTAGEVGVLSEPPAAERCLALEIGDAVFGSSDPTVE
jgi:hypothetical protein